MNAMPNMTTDIKKGLEGVVADATAVSDVDGEAGKLYYRGYTIDSLAQSPGRFRFAAVAHLIVFGELPAAERLEEFENDLWLAGQLPSDVTDALDKLTMANAHPMAILQAITPLLALHAPAKTLGRTADEAEGLVIAARIPAAVAYILHRQQRKAAPKYPDTRRYGERYLQLINGTTPSPQAVDTFECTQMLQLDHSFNASTFTARVITSTLAPMASALGGAMGALYGPLHGRADQAALEMAEEVGDASQARAYVTASLAAKKLVMGMGHREYRVVDPRAKIIKRLAEGIAATAVHKKLLQTLIAVESEFVEQTAARSRALRANLEFYKGVVYLSLGIPKDFFTASFAAARVFGWLAHSVEQRKDNRIIRPSALYVGPPPREA